MLKTFNNCDVKGVLRKFKSKKQLHHSISWYYSILAAQGSCSIIVIRLRQLKTGKVGKLIFHNE